MKKMISVFLTITILFYSVASDYVTVRASSEGMATDDTYVTALSLPFSMLDAILYSIAGQQAYDTYSDRENQQTLHDDFIDFCSETQQGADLVFKINMTNAYVAKTTLQDCATWYKTSGSSALSDVADEAVRNFEVITGGGTDDENSNDDSNSDDVSTLASISSTGLLTGIIGDYITQLTNGERGEVSETFTDGGQYFNGNYNIVDGIYYYDYWGNGLLTAQNGNDMDILGNYTQVGVRNIFDYFGSEVVRPSLYINVSQAYNWVGGTWVCPYYYGLVNGEVTYISNGNSDIYYNGIDIRYESIYNGFYFSLAEYMNIQDFPVFVSKEALEWYLNTGDASGAINYFKGVESKEEYYDFEFSKISEQLEEILKAFTTLPLITTEGLAGFAQGVNEQVAGQINPNSTSEEQEDAVKRAMEDNSKRTVAEELAEETKKTAEELAEELETTPVPSPTATPEEQVTRKEAQMIVDLHDFFPFCIPYDFVHLLKTLNATPKAPRFEGNILVMGKEVPVTLDFAQFEELASIFRTCETMLFILGLVLITRNLIRG